MDSWNFCEKSVISYSAGFFTDKGVLWTNAIRFFVDIEDYERLQSEKKLLRKLQEAEEIVKNNENWLTLDSLKKAMEN